MRGRGRNPRGGRWTNGYHGRGRGNGNYGHQRDYGRPQTYIDNRPGINYPPPPNPNPNLGNPANPRANNSGVVITELPDGIPVISTSN